MRSCIFLPPLAGEVASEANAERDEGGISIAQTKAGRGEPGPFRESNSVRRDQRMTSVLMRLGTSPTGTTALILCVATSIAVTERKPELAMKI